MKKSKITLVVMLLTMLLFTACAEQEEIPSNNSNMITPTVGLIDEEKTTLSPTPTKVPSPTLGIDASQGEVGAIEDSMPDEEAYLFEYEVKADETIRITGIKDKTVRTVCVPETIEDFLVTEIGEYAFFKCSTITYIELPSGVTWIGDGAFACCSSLVDISLPPGVTYIGPAAFADCSSMTDIELPDSLTSLENFLFHNCTDLNSVKIPFGIEKLFSDNVFLDCEALVSVEIPSSVKAIHDHIFDSCEDLQIIIVVEGSYAEVWANSRGYKVSYNYGR